MNGWMGRGATLTVAKLRSTDLCHQILHLKDALDLCQRELGGAGLVRILRQLAEIPPFVLRRNKRKSTNTSATEQCLMVNPHFKACLPSMLTESQYPGWTRLQETTKIP